jgi:hypothetical protein
VLADAETDKLAGFWRHAGDAEDGFGELDHWRSGVNNFHVLCFVYGRDRSRVNFEGSVESDSRGMRLFRLANKAGS